MKFHKEMGELHPIYESYDHYGEHVERPVSMRMRSRSWIYWVAVVLFSIFCCVALSIIILVPSIYFGVRKVVSDQCFQVATDESLPHKNFTQYFPNVRQILLKMPNKGSNSAHSVIVTGVSDSRVLVVGYIRALDGKALTQLVPKGSMVDGTLTISFEQDFVWPGYGCPTAWIQVYVPMGVSLDNIEIDNVLNGPTLMEKIVAKTARVNGGYSTIQLRENTISKLSAINYGGDVNLFRHTCEEINTTTTYVNLQSNGNLNVDTVTWCNNINIGGYNGKVVVRGVTYANTSMSINTRDGPQEISNCPAFREITTRSLSGYVQIKSSTDLPSTYFELISGSARVRVDGFTRITMDENEPSRKRGRMGCATICEKTIRVQSIRGTISLTKE
jgi:hypothetical protein